MYIYVISKVYRTVQSPATFLQTMTGTTVTCFKCSLHLCDAEASVFAGVEAASNGCPGAF